MPTVEKKLIEISNGNLENAPMCTFRVHEILHVYNEISNIFYNQVVGKARQSIQRIGETNSPSQKEQVIYHYLNF